FRLYSQAPVPAVAPVIAIPESAPASTSETLACVASSSVATVVTPGVTGVLVESIAGARLELVPPTTGASLTAVTVMFAVSVAVLKAVVVPFTDASAVAPFTPLLRSQARKVIAFATVPLKLSGEGCRYRRVLASAASKSAALSDTEPTAVQFVPPSVV